MIELIIGILLFMAFGGLVSSAGMACADACSGWRSIPLWQRVTGITLVVVVWASLYDAQQRAIQQRAHSDPWAEFRVKCGNPPLATVACLPPGYTLDPPR
jgi:hypothetical protein